MENIKWDNTLSVGVELIDEQHKMLIQKLYSLSEAIEKGAGELETVKALDFMTNYTDFHFSAEEELMEKHSYPELENQKEKHAEFKGYLKQLVEDFQEEGPTKAFVNSVNVYLINWLIKHIKGEDLKIGEFLKS